MEKKRQPNFTAEEIEVLTTGVEKRAKLLLGTLGASTTAAMKQRGWEGVVVFSGVDGGFDSTCRKLELGLVLEVIAISFN